MSADRSPAIGGHFRDTETVGMPSHNPRSHNSAEGTPARLVELIFTRRGKGKVDTLSQLWRDICLLSRSRQTFSSMPRACSTLSLKSPLGQRWSLNAEYLFPWWQWRSKHYTVQTLSGHLEGRYWLGDRRRKGLLEGFFVARMEAAVTTICNCAAKAGRASSI